MNNLSHDHKIRILKNNPIIKDFELKLYKLNDELEDYNQLLEKFNNDQEGMFFKKLLDYIRYNERTNETDFDFSDGVKSSITIEYRNYLEVKIKDITNKIYRLKYGKDVNNKYTYLDIVQHMKTENLYIIINIPNENKLLEKSREPFYTYVEYNNLSNEWNRSKSEMEDGRFNLIHIK